MTDDVDLLRRANSTVLRFTFVATVEEYLTIARSTALRNRRSLVSLIIFMALIGGLVDLVFLQFAKPEDATLGHIWAIAIAALTLIAWWSGFNRRLRRRFADQASPNAPVTWEVDRTGIQIKDDLRTCRFAWAAIRSGREDRKSFTFRVDVGLVVWLPKRAVTSDTDCKAIRDVAHAELGSRFEATRGNS